MIYFLASRLSYPSGGSRAGADFLHALLLVSQNVAVVCQDRCAIPKNINNISVNEPMWFIPSEVYKIPSFRYISFRYFINIARKIEKSIKLKWMLTRNPPILAIHNGFPVPDSTNSELLDHAHRRVLVIHSSPKALDFFRKRTPSLTRDFVAKKMRDADLVIFVSPQIENSWTKISGIDNNRTTVISNTTRESEAERVAKIPFRKLREDLGLKVDNFIVACVGKVDPAKGQDLIIEALPGMLEAKPSLHVVFVGQITPAGYEIIDRAEKLGVSQNCSFVGSHNSAYPFIHAADMLIHPSRAEGQGMVILEAMVLGTPVLATRVGGIPFSIEHGKSGWLVPSDDSETLLSGFRKLATNSSLRNHLVRKARNRYWEVFSRKRYISMIDKSISKVLL